MFYIKMPNGKYDVYVIADSGEQNPMRGEKNVRENEFPFQKYYHFSTNSIKDFPKIEDLETDLYVAGIRFEQAVRNGDSMLFERKEEFRDARDILEGKLMDTSSDLELTTSSEIKSDLECMDFFKSADEIKRYYYKNEGEMLVIAVKGKMSEDDEMYYLDCENKFLEMQVKKITAEREDLLNEVKDYAKEHNHSVMLMSGVKFQMLSNIMYEKTKLVNSENNSLSNSVENSNVERKRPRFV